MTSKAFVFLTMATASQVTPVEKVINLLEGMKTEVEKEGKAEAISYQKFACFCKDSAQEGTIARTIPLIDDTYLIQ